MDQPMPPTRDKVYYFQNVIFQAGNTLFRIPRDIFNTPGTIFEAMFALPPTPDAEGITDENPIVLSVEEDHFRGFLRVTCGPRGQKVPDEDLIKALDLAMLWGFEDIRRETIQALDGWAKSQSLKQIVLIAKKYEIVPWLEIAYSQLASKAPLPFDELTKPPAVDWETIARLLYAQQRMKHGDISKCCPQCRTGKFCCKFIAPQVQSLFKAEFDSMTSSKTCFKEPDLPEDNSDDSNDNRIGIKRKRYYRSPKCRIYEE